MSDQKITTEQPNASEAQLSAIQENRAASKYTRGEQIQRVAWILGLFFFRLTPRPCFGIRRWILRLFGAKIGPRVNTYSSTWIYFPWNLEAAADCAIGEEALIYNLGKVTLGERTTISQRAHLCAGTHDYTLATMPLLKPPITIGSDVWICADAFVGPDVVVQDGAVVAARAVVVKNVDAWTIVGGNPAKRIKERKKFQA